MILVIDIGNTNITCGIYQEEILIKTFRLTSDRAKTKDAFIDELESNTVDYKITECIIGSVVDELNNSLKQACDEVFGIQSYLFDTTSKTGIILDVEKPETVGADRIANTFAVYKKYKTCYNINVFIEVSVIVWKIQKFMIQKNFKMSMYLQ